MRKKSFKDPAILNYFFGKGREDLRSTITESWESNGKLITAYYEKTDSEDEIPGKVINWSIAVSIAIFGSAFIIVAASLHAIIFGFCLIIFYLGFSILWLVERIYLAVKSFFLACPYCHKKSLVPEYFCDSCNATHAQLFPNAYGIFYHRCLCGKSLSATFFLNRGRLKSRCPSCHEGLEREYVESKRIFVPVMGGPSAGKSAFLFSAIKQLIEQKEMDTNFSAEPFDPLSERAYQNIASTLNKGLPPEKTREAIPRAFNLALKQKGQLKFLLYLYDPAGEAYHEANQLTRQGYNGYYSGMIFIIDPFSIPVVREKYKAQLDASSDIRPSELPIEDALERLTMTLEADFGLAKKGQVKKPLAIVFSKTDAFDLENLIGDTAVERAFNNLGEPEEDEEAPTRQDVRNRVLRQQLIEWEQQAFVNLVDRRFKNVCYFSSASLAKGAVVGKAGFVASGVLPPLLWVFGHVSESDFQGHEQKRL